MPFGEISDRNGPATPLTFAPARLLLAGGLVVGLASFALTSRVGSEMASDLPASEAAVAREVHGMLASLAGLFGLILSLGCVAFEFVRLARRRALNRTTWVYLALLWVLVLSPFAGAYASTAIPEALHRRRVIAAQEQCRVVIQRLESHRQAHGAYPATIDAWPQSLERSELLLFCEYHRDGNGRRYRIGLVEAVQNVSGFPLHVYDSQSGAWFSFEQTYDLSFESKDMNRWLVERGD